MVSQKINVIQTCGHQKKEKESNEEQPTPKRTIYETGRRRQEQIQNDEGIAWASKKICT
jgi:hypothetical protein